MDVLYLPNQNILKEKWASGTLWCLNSVYDFDLFHLLFKFLLLQGVWGQRGKNAEKKYLTPIYILLLWTKSWVLKQAIQVKLFRLVEWMKQPEEWARILSALLHHVQMSVDVWYAVPH